MPQNDFDGVIVFHETWPCVYQRQPQMSLTGMTLAKHSINVALHVP